MKIDRSRLTCALPILDSNGPVWKGLLGAVCLGALVALAGCSSSVESRLEKVRDMQANNQMEESIPILIELIEEGNRQGEILYRYGRALSLTGKPERSIWALDTAREDPEWFVRASQQLAFDAERGGNYDFGIDVFRRLHEEAPESIDNDPFGLLLEVRMYLNTQSRFDEALELVDSIIERFPEEEEAIRMKAVALLGLKRADDAYELLVETGVGPEGSPRPLVTRRRRVKIQRRSMRKRSRARDPARGRRDRGGRGRGRSLPRDRGRHAPGLLVHGPRLLQAGGRRGRRGRGDRRRLPRAVSDRHGSDDRGDSALFGRGTIRPGARDPRDGARGESRSREIRDALVQFLGRIGRDEDVEKILRESIASAEATGRGATAEMAALWVDLAGFLMEHDRVGEALVAFDKVNSIIGDNATPDLLLREAEALIRAKEFDEALRMADKTPIEVHAQMLRGRIAFERGEYEKALEILGQAALTWPDNAPIHYYRARAAESLGDFELAIEAYRQTIRSDPALTAARERLAMLHLAEGQFREASSILTLQSPRKPSTPSIKMMILMVEVDSRRGTEPDLDIPPDANHPSEKIRAEAVRSLSRGLAARVGPRVAAGVLANVEASAIPAIRGAFLRERVELLGEAGEGKEAVSEARAGLEARPDDIDTKVALARSLVRRGQDLDEAGRLLQSVVEERPADVDVLTAQGDLAARRGDAAAATSLYERALGVAPDHWPALSPIVDQLVAAGKQDEAITRLESFLRRDAPYDGRAVLALARLLPSDDESKERRVALVRRAIRFGAGEEGIDFLASIDPIAAADYELIEHKIPIAAPDAANEGVANPNVTSSVDAAEKPAPPEKGRPPGTLPNKG